MKKKILMIMMEAGSGHKVPAIAIKEKIEKINKETEIEIIDVAKDVGCKEFDEFYKGLWKKVLARPLSFKLSYPLLKTDAGPMIESLITKKLKEKLESYIKKSDPDLIFCTHFTSARIVGELKEEGIINIPSAVLVTDAIEPHRDWINKNNDYLIIYDAGDRKTFKDIGLNDKQIKEFNFPLRKEFTEKRHNKENLRKSLGLEKDIFTITFLSGGEGIGKLDRFIRPFMERDLKIQMVVICGRNEEIRNKIENIYKEEKKKGSVNNFILHAKGFVTNMQEFMEASDLMMGKSGISFTFESLIYNKPIIFTQTLPNETAALRYFVEKETAWYEQTPRKAFRRVMYLLENMDVFRRYKKNIEKLNIRNGSEDIANFLYNMIKKE